jgi:hypothetical protein
MKLSEIAKQLDCKLEDDGYIEITGVADLESWWKYQKHEFTQDLRSAPRSSK